MIAAQNPRIIAEITINPEANARHTSLSVSLHLDGEVEVQRQSSGNSNWFTIRSNGQDVTIFGRPSMLADLIAAMGRVQGEWLTEAHPNITDRILADLKS